MKRDHKNIIKELLGRGSWAGVSGEAELCPRLCVRGSAGFSSTSVAKVWKEWPSKSCQIYLPGDQTHPFTLGLHPLSVPESSFATRLLILQEVCCVPRCPGPHTAFPHTNFLIRGLSFFFSFFPDILNDFVLASFTLSVLSQKAALGRSLFSLSTATYLFPFGFSASFIFPFLLLIYQHWEPAWLWQPLL